MSKSKTKRGPPAKPFQKGNPWQIKPGEVKNPNGCNGINRPLVKAVDEFYAENPKKLLELVKMLHNAAVIAGDATSVQMMALDRIAKRLDREHLKEDGTDKQNVLEGITLEIAEGRSPERRGGAVAAQGARAEIDPDELEKGL